MKALERETGFEPATHCLGSLGEPPQRLGWFKAAEIAAFLMPAERAERPGPLPRVERCQQPAAPRARRPHTQVTETPHQGHGHSTQSCGPTAKGAMRDAAAEEPAEPATNTANTAFTRPAGRVHHGGQDQPNPPGRRRDEQDWQDGQGQHCRCDRQRPPLHTNQADRLARVRANHRPDHRSD